MPSRSILNILNIKDTVTTEDLNVVYRILNGMYDTRKAHGLAVKFTAFDGRLSTGQIDLVSYAVDVRNRELTQQRAFAARDGNNTIVFDVRGGKTYASGNTGTVAANQVIVNGTNAGGVLSGTYPNPAFASAEYVVFQPKMLMQWYGPFSTTSRADGFGGFNAEVTGAPGWVFCNAAISVKMRDGTTFTKPDFTDYLAIGPGTVSYTTKNTPITWGSLATLSMAHTHPGATHTHTLNAHTHDLVNHTHGLNSHVHDITTHTHGMNSHTHSMNAHVHDLGSHQHTLGSHTHTMNAHVHDITSHIHGLNSHTHGMVHSHNVHSHVHDMSAHTHLPGLHLHNLNHTHNMANHLHGGGTFNIPLNSGQTFSQNVGGTTTLSNIALTGATSITYANNTHTHPEPTANLSLAGASSAPGVNVTDNSNSTDTGIPSAVVSAGPSVANTGSSTGAIDQSGLAEPNPVTGGFKTDTDAAAGNTAGNSAINTGIPSVASTTGPTGQSDPAIGTTLAASPTTTVAATGDTAGITGTVNTGVPDAGHASTATPSTNSTGIVGTGSSANTDTSNNTAGNTGAASAATISVQPPVLAVYWIMKL